jgi:hypothetical protein
MDLIAKLPSMEAAQLAVLRDNATRLAQKGTRPQRAAASDLLPAIEAELAQRGAAKAAELKEAREARQQAAKSSKAGAAPKRSRKRAEPVAAEGST